MHSRIRPAGFIWDDAVAHGKSLRDFGEYTDPHRRWKDPTRKDTPGFLGYLPRFHQ